MGERDQGLKQKPEDILGIEWPTSNLSAENLETIVTNSHFIPLRQLIASRIIDEASNLWIPLTPPSDREWTTQEEDISVAINEGFRLAGRNILRASQYLDDGESFLNQQVNAIQITSSDNFYKNNSTDLREGLERERKDAIKSFGKDPRGLDWLKRSLSREAIVYDGTNDPGVMGLRIGIQRYKQLYDQAVFAGATPDKKDNPVRSLIAKTKRKFEKRH